MPEHIFFHLVFLSQILLISFYYPRKILNRMRYVFETYPPSTYPKLYPKPIEYYTKAPRNYRSINLFILLAVHARTKARSNPKTSRLMWSDQVAEAEYRVITQPQAKAAVRFRSNRTLSVRSGTTVTVRTTEACEHRF